MFLESITFTGNDVLIPIDRIKYINYGYYENSFQIKIYSDDGDWIECFDDDKKAQIRYQQIKNIVGAK